MKILIIVNSTPYGTEGPYNALRLTEALLASGERVDLFLMGDGVHTARRRQDPRDAHKSIEGMLAMALSAGADVGACGTCCRTRGLEHEDLVDAVEVLTIHDLASLVGKADKVVSF